MSWRAITEDDIRSALTAPEDEAYRSQLLSSGQTDPLEIVKQQVVTEFRNAIRSCPKNRLHATATYLPEGSIYHAVAVIRYRLLSRLAIGEQDQPGDARTNEFNLAMSWLKEVRACREMIEAPDGDGTEVPSAGNLEQIAPARRRADREGLSGL